MTSTQSTPSSAAKRIQKALGRLGVDELGGADIAAALDLAEAAKGWCARTQERAKALIAAGQKIPGWMLKPTSPQRSIDDAHAAYNRSELSLPDFLACCAVRVRELENAISTAVIRQSPTASGEVETKRRLAGIVTSTPRNPSLARAANA